MQFPPISPVVKNLLIINIIFFIATYALSQFELVRWLSAFYIASPNFHVWQPITYMFMHGGLEHIFFNMFALFMFGTIIEQTLGWKRFIEYYFITGVGALVLHMLVQAFEIYSVAGTFTVSPSTINPDITQQGVQKIIDIYRTPILGASGAIFGVLLAFAYLFPDVEMMVMFIPVPIKAKYLVPGYMAIELYLGVKGAPGDSVAHFAHIGGAIFGFILLKIWGYKSYRNF